MGWGEDSRTREFSIRNNGDEPPVVENIKNRYQLVMTSTIMVN